MRDKTQYFNEKRIAFVMVRTRKAKRSAGRIFIVSLAFIGLLVGFSLSTVAWQKSEARLALREEEQELLEDTLRMTQAEKQLLEEQLLSKEEEFNNLVTGAVSMDGVEEYRAYLTFDDGPSENAMAVMDILDAYGIKATFFMNGEESDLAREVYSRVIEDGHVLANHTYSHSYGRIYQSWEGFYQDIREMENCVRAQTGYEVAKIVRFPGGSNSGGGNAALMNEIKTQLTNLGYQYVDWNVSGEDAIHSNVSGSQIYRNIVRYVEGKNVAVILLHTTNRTSATVRVLPDIIDYLLEEGYSFHAFDEPDAPFYVAFH